MRLPLPIGLIQEVDEVKDIETSIRVNWININSEKLLRVISCMQFEISNYKEQGFRLAFCQMLTKYDGSIYNKNTGFLYKVQEGKDVVVERIITDMKNFDTQLREFVEHCNEFYILHCEPYNKPL